MSVFKKSSTAIGKNPKRFFCIIGNLSFDKIRSVYFVSIVSSSSSGAASLSSVGAASCSGGASLCAITSLASVGGASVASVGGASLCAITSLASAAGTASLCTSLGSSSASSAASCSASASLGSASLALLVAFAFDAGFTITFCVFPFFLSFTPFASLPGS